MTQDVQPLTWQKRTNIEEHQQFFSKINEIIGNLAPTVDEAEQAIAQANAAIASANDAASTANAASAAASAAASQAQTAASTVAGYDGRLTAAEGDIDTNTADITALQGRMGTAEGNIASLDGRMTAAETKNSQQDTAIGALQAADSNNVKITGTHKIGDYAVLLTGNQDIAGDKNFLGHIIGNIRTGRITSTDSLDITSEYDGMQIYYIFMSQVNSVAGLPSGIENGGAILMHSRGYGYGDETKNYVFYTQILFSSSGKIYTRRHTSTTDRSTSAVTWGKENWKMFSFTEVPSS